MIAHPGNFGSDTTVLLSFQHTSLLGCYMIKPHGQLVRTLQGLMHEANMLTPASSNTISVNGRPNFDAFIRRFMSSSSRWINFQSRMYSMSAREVFRGWKLPRITLRSKMSNTSAAGPEARLQIWAGSGPASSTTRWISRVNSPRRF